MGDDSNTNRASTSNKTSRGRGTGSRGSRSWRPYPRRNANHGPPNVRPTVLPIPEQRTPSNGSSSSAGSSTVGPNNLNPATSVYLDERPSFLGWKLYFPGEDFKTSTSIVRQIKAFETHYDDNSSLYDVDIIRNKRYFTLSLQALSNDEKFSSNWTSFTQDLSDNPETTLCCASLAMYQRVFDKKYSSHPSGRSGQISTNSFLQVIRARIQGFGPAVTLRSIKLNSYGRLVAVRGTVIRASAPEILCTWMAFRCSSCNKQQAVMQPEGVMTMPTSCKDGCRARSNFIPLLSSPYTRTEAYQLIRLQESMAGDHYDPGHVPKNIDVELTEDLVDSVCPGDDVTITGVSKVKPQDDVQRRDQASLYKTYMRAASISSNKNSITNRKSEFTEKDLQGIKMISEEPCPFRLLIHSLCPGIYGHEIVKAGLLLGLFGGSSLNATRRTETHVLVVGDPGLGKSQMLQACANVSPRGIFVCGNSSSSAGLTATVRQEKGCGRGGTLEAGALVLADQGACCIDEFDKMTSNHHALLEVMEQQTVSVAKAGVLCSLPARTSVLAAANPVGGHYNRSKTISENLRMSPALLSRFDLVFILLDRPDEQLDSLLTAHIQSLNSNGKRVSSSSSGRKNHTPNSAIIISSQDPAAHLKERLKLAKNENLDLLPHVLMQKYIAYARKHIHPKLNSEAAQELKQFYLELRKECSGVDAIPVTTRQLEALIRLTQARARIELATEANREHAIDVISIIRYSLIDVFTSEDGTLELDRSINGSGMSQATQVRKFVRLLENRSRALNKSVFDGNELKDIAYSGLLTMSFSQLVDSLNIQGILLKKGTNLYKLLVD